MNNKTAKNKLPAIVIFVCNIHHFNTCLMALCNGLLFSWFECLTSMCTMVFERPPTIRKSNCLCGSSSNILLSSQPEKTVTFVSCKWSGNIPFLHSFSKFCCIFEKLTLFGQTKKRLNQGFRISFTWLKGFGLKVISSNDQKFLLTLKVTQK